MATLNRTHESIPKPSKSSDNGLILVWLDDSAEEDLTIKEVLSSIYDNVFIFTDHEACLELVQSMDIKIPCLAILISGKYGQMLVRDHLQPLNPVKDIYVFCFDTVKHGRWAQTCDKVRCIFSDINKILQCMQYDIQNTIEQQQSNDEQVQEPKKEHQERYTDDNNLFDQIALNLILQSSDDGAEDFTNYCQIHNVNNNSDHHETNEEEQNIKEWYHSNAFLANINSNDLTKLWTLRWFIKLFHRQLTDQHEKFIKEKTKFTVHYGIWLSTDELDGMKHRVGHIIIITEFLMTYKDRQKALDNLRTDDNHQHKVLFEINVDTTIQNTIPYGEIENEQVLFWFGARYRLIKIQYIEQEDNPQNTYWLIGLNLYPILDVKPSLQTLYQYYLKEFLELNNIHHAFGRILMYKGFYSQAATWLQTDNHYYELAEIAIRQNHIEQAKQYLEKLSEECDYANLLRAYLNILISNDNISKARLILMRIISESTDKILRARANIALGFISLMITQQIAQAFDYFTLANEVLKKILPPIHPILAKSYIGIGYTYYSQHHFLDARKCFEKAFSIQKQSLTYNHPDFAKTRNGLAHCLSTDKQTIKHALNELEYAYNILLDVFQHEYQHHPEILATKNDMEKLRKGKELHTRSTLLDYI